MCSNFAITRRVERRSRFATASSSSFDRLLSVEWYVRVGRSYAQYRMFNVPHEISFRDLAIIKRPSNYFIPTRYHASIAKLWVAVFFFLRFFSLSFQPKRVNEIGGTGRDWTWRSPKQGSIQLNLAAVETPIEGFST